MTWNSPKLEFFQRNLFDARQATSGALRRTTLTFKKDTLSSEEPLKLMPLAPTLEPVQKVEDSKVNLIKFDGENL